MPQASPSAPVLWCEIASPFLSGAACRGAVAEVQKLMNDPAFKAQAEQMVAGMKASGGLDMADLARKAQQAMGAMGGAGGDELERLRRENALLKNAMRDEL